MYLKKLTAILIFILCVSVLSAQVNPDLQQVGVPTPTAAQFQKYLDYPVNSGTGVPEISIPIYTVVSSKLKVPISFSYHAAGFKPADDNGIIGLGWSLNAGGRISRTVFGKRDEANPSPSPVREADTMHMAYLDNQNYILSLNNTTSEEIDEDMDLFYYSAGNSAGKFLLKNTGSGTRTPAITSFRPVKITSNTSTYFNTVITFFEIVDEDGITYHYGTPLTGGLTAIETSESDRTNPWTLNNSSWMLTEMISADKSDTIRFKYLGPFQGGSIGTRTDNFIVSYPATQTFSDGSGLGGGSNCTGFPSTTTYSTSYDNVVYSVHSSCILSEIDYKNGKVVFNYSGPNSFNNSTGHTLYKIMVEDTTGKLMQTYQLFQSNFGPSSNYNLTYYKMDSLKLYDANNSYINTYTFAYTNSTTSSVPTNVTENLGIDYWGFYNGHTENAMLLPNWQVAINAVMVPAGNANRDADSNAVRTFILNKIQYPTGGSSSFDFEPNEIPGTSAKVVGGLRIRRITNTAATGVVTYKRFKYGQSLGDESGFGTLQIDPYFSIGSFTSSIQNYNSCDPDNGPLLTANYINTITTYHSNFIDGSGIFQTNPIFYTDVTEYDGYDPGSDNGKTLYIYTLPSSSFYNAPFQRHLALAIDWYGGELTSKIIYKNTSGTYSALQEEDYTFQERETDSITGTKVLVNLTGNNTNAYGTLYQYEEALFDNLNIAYQYWNYAITTGINQLMTKTHTDYTSVGNVVTVTNFTYNTNHNWPITTSTTDSKGLSLVENNKYPTDLTLSGYEEDARTKMVSRNILSPVLQRIITRNGTQDFLQNNNYKDFGSGIPNKESIDVQVSSNPIERRIQFLNYDRNANLLSQQKDLDLIKSYIWDYDTVYPVAEVINAKLADIAFTSFEADGKGNWTYFGNTTKVTIAPFPPTGTSYYNITTSATMSKTGLAIGKVYVISYWSKNGAYSITGGTQIGGTVTGKLINGWTYYEHKITATSSTIVMAAVSGTGAIDEVRLYPLGALMTTYTFTPHVGMTSQCDADNKISYYSYDGLQRLAWIKDQDGNIIKTFQYHYQGQW